VNKLRTSVLAMENCSSVAIIDVLSSADFRKQ
jgi:hypothetical protein